MIAVIAVEAERGEERRSRFTYSPEAAGEGNDVFKHLLVPLVVEAVL